MIRGRLKENIWAINFSSNEIFVLVFGKKRFFYGIANMMEEK